MRRVEADTEVRAGMLLGFVWVHVLRGDGAVISWSYEGRDRVPYLRLVARKEEP